MSAYEENFKEKEEQAKYSKKTAIFTFLVSAFVSLAVVGWSLPGDTPIIFWFFSVPMPDAYGFYLSGLSFLLLARWWWNGLPNFFRKVRAPKLLKKVPILSILVPQAAYIGIPEKFFKGRRRVVYEFLHQGPELDDFLPRAEKFYYLRGKLGGKILTPMNFFDYEPDMEIVKYYSGKSEEELKALKAPIRSEEEARNRKRSLFENRVTGTQRIILSFRDKKRERYIKKAESSNPKVAKKWKKILTSYDGKYRKIGRPSPAQIHEYRDLMSVIEGLLQGYTHKVDGEVVSKIHKARIRSPLQMKMEKKTGRVVSAGIDKKADIYRNGKIYYSTEMVVSTMNRLVYLFWRYFSRVSHRQGAISRRIKRGGIDYDNIEERAKVLDLFKFMLFRKFLGAYSSIPSSWYCVRIEDYDFRAVVSAIDRPMIPVITNTNDGNNDLYSSDVFAEGFLLLWWGFFKSQELEDIADDIDWAFNAIKDLNEIEMRKYAEKIREEARKQAGMESGRKE